MEVAKNEHSKLRLFLGHPTTLLMLVLCLGGILRFYDLGTESYWIDEMSTVIEGQQTFHQLLTVGRLDQPPAYYLPFHLWEQLFGISEVSTRSFSALIGMGSIILIYLIGRELFGKSIGLLAAFLMAISEFQITFSQTARFYIFFEFTALLSVLFFILSLKNKRTMFFGFYIIASVLMICSHAFGLFVLAIQNLFFFIYVRKYRDMIITWFVCQALIGMAIIPYFYPILFGKVGMGGEISENIGDLSVPSISEPLRSVYHFIFSARRERSWQVILVNYIIAGIVFLIGFGIQSVRHGKNQLISSVRASVADLWKTPDFTSSLLFVGLWFLGPIMLPFVLSFVVTPIYKGYYTISAAPAFYLLVALGLFGTRKVVPLLVSLGVLVIMIAPNLSQYYATDINEQWKEAAGYVQKNSGLDDVIVFAPNMGIGIQQKTFSTYYQGGLPNCGLSNQIVDPVMIAEELKQCVSGHRRFWVVIYGTPESDTIDRYQSFFHGGYVDAAVIDEQQFKTLYVYLFEMED